MSSYFCLIKLSARFITDVFRGNRVFFSQKLAFAILRLLLANNTRKLLLIGMNIISISKKKSLKKLTFFLGWHLKNGSDFFFFKLPRIFFSSYTSTEASNHDDTNSISISRNNHHQIDQISKHSNCAGYSHDRYFQFNILNFRKNSRK